MGENTIFYNAGFKSYEITRCKEGAETWYEWTERSRNLVRRAKISIKVLRWLISVFIEASTVKGDSVKRWKVKDLYSDFFCTLKYNEKGRYISFIAIQGQNKAVILTPESSYNTGWGNIAHKIAKFTYEPTTEQKTQFNKGKALGVSFKDAVRNNRWTTESTKKVHILVEGDHLKVVNVTPTLETDLLKRCIVGKFQTTTRDLPTLNDVRSHKSQRLRYKRRALPFRATHKSCCRACHGKNMGLEEDASEPRVVEPNHRMLAGSYSKRLGVDKTEEETTLKNPMHWARIKVKGDGKMVPKEIEIPSEGFVYIVPIWCEAPVTFRKEATRREEQHYGPMGNKSFFPPLMLKSVEELDHHVGTSTAGKNLNWRSRDSTREANSKGKGPLSAEGRKATDKDAAQIKKKSRDNERLSEPLHDEIEANCRILMEQGREGVLIPFELGDEGNNLEFVADLSDDDDMSIIQTEERTDQEIQTVSDMQLEQKADGEGTIEDILPLNSNEHGTDTSAENEISS
ncbi:hypothetical protein H5410_012710 [Solanum commersonii]|uniref:DUF4283 domain-containing protein n=1 Tax=Solanum commersonii TaxID=4109 RepID=A0A9J6ASX7_SOLCO|nr:hypothetical protein H5410_012710 [Solanum commersonii]